MEFAINAIWVGVVWLLCEAEKTFSDKLKVLITVCSIAGVLTLFQGVVR